MPSLPWSESEEVEEEEEEELSEEEGGEEEGQWDGSRRQERLEDPWWLPAREAAATRTNTQAATRIETAIARTEPHNGDDDSNNVYAYT